MNNSEKSSFILKKNIISMEFVKVLLQEFISFWINGYSKKPSGKII